ncbi:MAG: hypothetical protein F6K19_35690 [Cyanothece sp. SIO1E1]|nr:hypothetical protein [Cyanothece sp. SIO1E1]
MLHALQKRLALLEAERERLKAAGDYLQGLRLERSPAGGNASMNAKLACKYARLRAGRGKTLRNGKKSQYIPLQQIGKYEVAIARGQQLTQVEKQIAKTQLQLRKLKHKAEALGLLPSIAES